jgi:hypothetical protein
MLDTALDFVKRISYTRIFLYSSKELKISKLYLKKWFCGCITYNNEPLGQIYLWRKKIVFFKIINTITIIIKICNNVNIKKY